MLLLSLLFNFQSVDLFQTEEDEAVLNKVRSKKVQKKFDERKKTAKVESVLDDQFAAGRVYGM